MLSVIRFAEFYCVFSVMVHWTSVLAVGLRARWDKAAPRAPADAPGVSVVRPVRGIENHIEATLRSAFHLTYPRTEILFCVASETDPIVPVVRLLMAEYADVPARLLVGDDRISINPKLNNLVKGWEAAAYDWIVMVDSNVMLPPDYVEQLFAHWRPDTGLVSAPPVGSAPDGLAAELECAFLNTYQARWQLAADAFGLGFAHGKNLFCRRDIIEKAGGIRALAEVVAEDAAATKIVRRQGLRVRVMPRPFPQPLGRRTLRDVWHRQLRWARLRRSCFGLYFYPEIFSSGFLPILAISLVAAFGAISPFVALLYVAVWYFAEWLLARMLDWPTSIRAPLLWMVRDLMLPVLWCVAMLGAGYAWRGNAVNVSRGKLQLVEE